MMHRAWSSIVEVPYCFSRSYVKFEGQTALKIVKFDPNWAFPDCNSSLNSPMAMKCCTKLETAKERCSIVFQGHPPNFKVTRYKTSPILTEIERFWTIGRSQLSNPSDLPCCHHLRRVGWTSHARHLGNHGRGKTWHHGTWLARLDPPWKGLVLAYRRTLNQKRRLSRHCYPDIPLFQSLMKGQVNQNLRHVELWGYGNLSASERKGESRHDQHEVWTEAGLKCPLMPCWAVNRYLWRDEDHHWMMRDHPVVEQGEATHQKPQHWGQHHWGDLAATPLFEAEIWRGWSRDVVTSSQCTFSSLVCISFNEISLKWLSFLISWRTAILCLCNSSEIKLKFWCHLFQNIKQYAHTHKKTPNIQKGYIFRKWAI